MLAFSQLRYSCKDNELLSNPQNCRCLRHAVSIFIAFKMEELRKTWEKISSYVDTVVSVRLKYMFYPVTGRRVQETILQ